MIYFDENGDFRTGISGGEPQKKSFVFGSPFCHAPTMLRTDVMKKVGGYTIDKRYLRIEDYNLWTKIFAAGHRGYNLSESLYKMRDDRNAARRRTLKARWNSTCARFHTYKLLKIPWYYYPCALMPTIIGLMPNWLYSILRKFFRHS
jgi:glycosyltransferase EpsE